MWTSNAFVLLRTEEMAVKMHRQIAWSPALVIVLFVGSCWPALRNVKVPERLYVMQWIG